MPDQRRGIYYKHDHIIRTRLSHERDHTMISIVKIDPLEPIVRIVQLPKRRLVLINVIQMLHEPAQSIVPRELQQLPIQLAIMVPFASLGELTAHEQQFFARLPIHPSVKQSE